MSRNVSGEFSEPTDESRQRRAKIISEDDDDHDNEGKVKRTKKCREKRDVEPRPNPEHPEHPEHLYPTASLVVYRFRLFIEDIRLISLG